jgi:hypothetical protein
MLAGEHRDECNGPSFFANVRCSAFRTIVENQLDALAGIRLLPMKLR